MTGSKALSSCREIDLDTACAIGLLFSHTRSHSYYSITDIDTPPIRIHIAESANQVEEGTITTHVKD
jgi:hypothetical protein